MKYDASNISRKNFEEILNLSSDAIIALDEFRKIIIFNTAAEELFGYDEAEILGQSLDILLPENVRPYHDKYLDTFDKHSVRSRSMVKRSTVQGRTKSNTLIPLDISIQKHTKGGILRYSAVIREMSSHFAAIDVLEKSKERLSRAQRIAHLGHWEWNILTGGLIWSDEIYRIFGQTKGVDEVSYENFLNVIHPEDRSNVANYVAWCVEHKMPYVIMHRIICPNGEEKIVREKGEIFCNEEGTAVRMDGTVQDITESWEREKKLREVSEQAKAANKAKSQFLATMSHELRTPLNAIIGLSTMIEEEIFGPILPDKYKEYVTDIKKSGYHLLSHINNILDVSNVEMKKIEAVRVEVASKNLIETSIQMVKTQSFSKNIHYNISIDDQLQDIYVDPTHCKKILINLLSNAIKFSHHGGEIRIKLNSDIHNKNLVFLVQDFGVGFSDKDVDTLFMPFTQMDMDFSRKYEGAGLGLSIVKALTEAQGGHVTLESTVGEGTLVKVTLPINILENDSRWI